MPYTFHVTGLATTQTNDKFSGCPYTAPAYLLVNELVRGGHKVYHYCNTGSETDADDIFVMPDGVLQKAFGEKHWTQYHADPKPDGWSRVCKDFSIACAAEIRKNAKHGDFVLLPSDGTQDLNGLLEDIEGLRCVETNIGYSDPISPYRVFPTHTWRSFWRGRAERANDFYEMFKDTEPFINHNPNIMVPVSDPRWVRDTVIYYLTNPENFEFNEKKGGDYFLYLGRMIQTKGILEAVELTKELGKKLIVAGPGDYRNVFEDKIPKHVDFIGMANKEKRLQLYADAECVLILTRYNEPGGTIVAEAGYAGRPVITANSGCFTELVQDEKTGFRGDCHAEWVEAAEKLHTLDPKAIRKHADETFAPEVLMPKYEAFFKRIDAYEKSGGDESFTF